MPKSFYLIVFITIINFACKRSSSDINISTSDIYNKAFSFYNVNNDSAFYYFNKLVTSSTDSVEVAVSYTYMGIIQSAEGDYFGSQESLLQSMKHFDEKKAADSAYILSNYNELGNVSLNLKNYDAAIGYYDKALSFTKNTNSIIIALSNKAVAYQKKQAYNNALIIYDSIINISISNTKRYARLLSNMAFTKWLKDSNYYAAPDLIKALNIQQNEKDMWGQNAGYAHLADYYFKKQPDSALLYSAKMYAAAQQLNSPDDELEALQKLIALSPCNTIKTYFKRYQFLSDSLQTSRNNAKNQFALIRYEVAKNKADNLNLQKDNAEKKLQVYILLTALIIIIISVVFIYQWLKKRRQQMLHDQQLKTSQKVHDVVANGLYHLMIKIKYNETKDKEMLLDEVEWLYEQSRDISYDHQPKNSGNYFNTITNMIESFGTDETKVSIVGNSEGLWEAVQSKAKQELMHILKELMVNMQKHSNAQNVVIRFTQQDDALLIFYTDDGKGITNTFSYNNGLNNTETRIKHIQGKISFDTSTTGLKIQLQIPIAKP